ncbi:MAG: hypothetical protein AABX29_07140 [Nanoarchaeota archaeon]
MNKKAQVQFMEMIFVLLILIIIILIGLVFYYSFLHKGIKEKKERFTEIDAIILTDSVSSMAELTHETGVINSVKLFSLAKKIKSTDYKEYYANFFGNDKKVTLEIIYPPVNNEKQIETLKLDCTSGTDIDAKFHNKYTNPTNECQKFTIYDPGIVRTTGTEIRTNPVSVYYPLTNEYRIGILKVEVFKNE